MINDTDIVIAGGGLNGTVLALALSGAGFSVTLIDARPTGIRADSKFDGRAYALSHASCRMLQALGLWDALAETAHPILEIKVSDGRTGSAPSPLALEFHHGEIEEGPMGHMVEDRHLRAALLDAVAAHGGITELSGDPVIAQETHANGASVTLASGARVTAGLLIGCDGRDSGTARRAGIRRTGWGYGQTGMVAAIAHELPNHGIAHQLFLPEGPLAILPLTGNRCSIVWTMRTEDAAAVNALPGDQYLDVLRPRFGDFLGQISLAGARFTYPLGLSLAQAMVADRVALVGDAAHALHPIAGQGLNAGLKDVATLAQVLTEARRRGEDFGRRDVLERYAGWRQADVAALALATDGFNRLFSNDNPLLRMARDAGLAVVNGWPGLRRNFIREAAGLTGDVPNLLQGRPI
jgi:2-octaprenyl-6-methoxyphenol hydroxylase